MAIQRKNPLPVGRYWVDVVATKSHPLAITTFNAWLARNGRAINVVKREDHSGTQLLQLDYTGITRSWVLFDVTAPVKWETNEGWGLPTIVQSDANPTAQPVQSSADTVTRPPTPTVSSMLSDLFADTNAVVLLALAVYAFSKSRR